MNNYLKILQGDCIEEMEFIPDNSVQCCVTSPPYFGLRDYGVDGQIGLEQTPEEYVRKMVEVFREVRRILKPDGTLWLNLGDTYAKKDYDGICKKKELIGVPWIVALALRADGWYLRQDIIWHKPNTMPEAVKDRCTKSHEYIFLLTKEDRYFFDSDAIKEPDSGKPSGNGFKGRQSGSSTYHADQNGGGGSIGRWFPGNGRNKRSVWTVTTKPYKGAHFATYPPDLIEPCILAGSRPNDVVFDPFGGSGTTAAVALKHARRAMLCELNPQYVELIKQRTHEVIWSDEPL